MNAQRIEEILDFWFGPLEGVDDFPTEKAKYWFRGGEDFNELIRKQFGSDVEAAQEGTFDDWQETPRGTLALVILLDQFTRNLNQDAKAYAADAKALGIAQQAVEKKFDLKLKRVERGFLYLPFEHSENLVMQEKCVALFEQLCVGVPPSVELPFANMLDYAKQHHVIIERFGRFPHRNQALQRPSTPEEIEFLKDPANSF